MAQVPATPTPQQVPSGAPVSPPHEEAPAAAFGANVAGAGLGDLGKTLTNVSDEDFQFAAQYAALNNKAESDNANGAFTVAAYKLADAYREANPGLAMSQNIGQLGDQLDALRTKLGGGLSLVGQTMYQADSRRNQSYIISGVNSTGVAAAHKYRDDADTGAITLQSQIAASHPGDLDALGADQQIIANHVHSMAQNNGWSPEQTQAEILKQGSAALKPIIVDMVAHNPMGAADLLQQYEGKGWMSPEDTALLDRDLHAPLVTQIGARLADGAITQYTSPTTPDGQQANVTSNFIAAIHSTEGGGNPQARNPRSTAAGILEPASRTARGCPRWPSRSSPN